LNLNYDEVVEYLDSMERDSKALKKHIFKLCWYMRGGISLNEMFELGFQDRQLIEKIVEENIEVTNETRMPFF
jgi:hypothetical protein